MNPQKYLVLINMALSVAIFYMSICRLNKSTKSVRVLVRAYYAVLLGASLANGFQTVIFGQQPTVAGVMFTGCVAFGMLTGIRRWGNGAPADTKKLYCPPECRL